MICETYSNTLFLAAKTKPRATTARDGTFCLQLLAYSRPASHVLVPWRVSYFGDDALSFWCQHGSSLKPGAAVLAELTALTLHEGGGRNHRAEMHAFVNWLQLLPNHSKSAQLSQDKIAPSPCLISANSY